MNNKLALTNGIWYKIKRFIKNIFMKKSFESSKEQILESQQTSNNSAYTNDLRTKFEKENENKALAEKLLYGEIGTIDLNEKEVDEMTEYFKKDIQNNEEIIEIDKKPNYDEKDTQWLSQSKE